MARSFGIVDDKLREADFFLGELRTRATFSTANHYFSAFLSSARSVTFALQASMSGVPGFEEWYQEQRAALASDPSARWFVDARNQSEKQGARFVGVGLVNDDGTRAHFPLLALGGDPQQLAQQLVDQVHRRKEEEEELGQRAFAYMRVLAGLVQRCYVEFATTVDPDRYYSLENIEWLGKSVEDVEEELGFPRGWTQGAPAARRIDMLKRSAPMPDVDDLLLKYLRVDRAGKASACNNWSFDQLVAYHEAGHTVVAHALGRRARRASILEDGVSRGHVLLQMHTALQKRLGNDAVVERDRRSIETFVMACYAGAGALTLLRVSQPNAGAEDDAAKAWAVLSRLAPGVIERETYRDWLRERCLNVLRLHWGAVRAVAVELTQQRELGGRRLTALIEEHLYESLEDVDW